MRISDWSSDVCSSDLGGKPTTICRNARADRATRHPFAQPRIYHPEQGDGPWGACHSERHVRSRTAQGSPTLRRSSNHGSRQPPKNHPESDTAAIGRSEEHTSELQSLMRKPYADFGLQKKNTK